MKNLTWRQRREIAENARDQVPQDRQMTGMMCTCGHDKARHTFYSDECAECLCEKFAAMERKGPQGEHGQGKEAVR